MKKLSIWLVSLLIVSGTLVPHSVVANPLKKNKTTSQIATKNSVFLLPQSELILEINLHRLITELLPKVKEAFPTETSKISESVDKLFAEALSSGVDLTQARRLLLGLNIFGDKVSGAMIFEGIELDKTLMENYLKSSGKSAEIIEYKGKTIVVEKKPQTAAKKRIVKSTKISPDNVKNVVSQINDSFLDTVSFVQLDNQRLAMGDPSEVKKIIDHLPDSEPTQNQKLAAAMLETDSSALIRLAVQVPDSFRQSMSKEQVFKSLTALQQVSASLNVADDLSLAISASLGTGSLDEASQLYENLSALIVILKSVMVEDKDPDTKLIGQLLSNLTLAPKMNNVVLSMTVPLSVYQPLLKSFQEGSASKKTSAATKTVTPARTRRKK